jgi:folate-binding protein YgfZ
MPRMMLDDRAVLAVTGADARPFLQGLLTNDVLALTPERPLWAGLLSPQGKALFDMILHDDGAGGVLIDCEAAQAGALARRLGLYRLRRAVGIAPRADLAVHVAWGDEAGEGPPDPRLAALGRRWVAAPGEAGDVAAWRRHRIALGVPEGVAELGQDRTLWLEANAVELGGVSFTKGCYVGQENTARMHHRDRVRRRLLPVRLDGDPGEAREVMAGERAAGELRAVAGDLGMAWLRVEQARGALRVGEVAASVLWPDWLDAD